MFPAYNEHIERSDINMKKAMTLLLVAALAALYAERYARFRLIYPAMKPLFKTLAR